MTKKSNSCLDLVYVCVVLACVHSDSTSDRVLNEALPSCSPVGGTKSAKRSTVEKPGALCTQLLYIAQCKERVWEGQGGLHAWTWCICV